MPELFISVVIPTFNRRDTLEHVLPTLVQQSYPNTAFEICLSDSGSTDGTREMVEAMHIPNLHFITGPNRGRSGARNRGIQAARGDIILFTDADILADQHLLEEHAKIHAMEPHTAMVGCEVQVDTLDEYHETVAHPEKRRLTHRRRHRLLPWYFYLTGNASAPREALLRVGMFDEQFTGYGHEDIELGYRLQRAGLPIRYHPEAVNYHWHPLSFEERCEKMRLSGVSTVRFYRKYKDWRINMSLGVNPLALCWHALLPASGVVMRACSRKVETSPFCRELVLQHHYLSGVKAAMNDTEPR